VTHVSCVKHRKPGKAPSLRVDYQCGLIRYSEWVCLEHKGYAGKKAESWWRARHPGVIPKSIDDALAWISHLATPSEIQVRPNGRFSEIINARFDPCATAKTRCAPSAIARPAGMAGSMPASASMTRAGTRAGKPFAA
jgi:DNA repair protein RadD